MSKWHLTACLCIAFFGCASLAQAQNEKSQLKDQKQKVSYGIGYNLGQNLMRDNLDLDPQVLAKGIMDAMTKQKPQMTEDEIRATLLAFQQQLQKDAQTKMQKEAEANVAKGKKFLADNAKKEGVKTTKSGLQYKVIKSGSGKTPKLTDEVTTHYRGTLIDGTEFDSSYKRKQPATFPVNRVIGGWTEALQLMKEGDKWQLFIPSDLAYGERGSGPDIGPNEVLIFDIELLKVN
ncbi:MULTISPECIES: FKBP-type peptidyl-prolyl cis-trans isomerase [Gimesia]|jgi:FKBP-type peptidyl-prolyl cis-trans isomerase FklB|uniref:Peptidyl-prolyl cis-trans isomerase n=2 Tax=Gimesia TaxID=1649453 RepID=A0A6I6AF44_9PLAN|nr:MULTISPECIES: FKBP-type peptidyl-prolyl cis-trans isomerase [Gimesia]MCR9234075.1 FKBP-type peptidyl-prolyl cis-trans isomerase [bacterium]QDT24686.1 Peptidyl-prolyl cis-trans isomerase Mip precursor [Gimesia chilikensis]QDT88360.1 Peptidyl-prolyl cis-trans isomerase Mip precursor [Gimesia chilikensis]QGQ23741.1 FKBP-type peptidyl-prolyl cis-trans isomerase [Gimesia benthica]